MIDELVYDPSNPDTLRNPHPIFERLREEDPVHWSEPMLGWVVTSAVAIESHAHRPFLPSAEVPRSGTRRDSGSESRMKQYSVSR